MLSAIFYDGNDHEPGIIETGKVRNGDKYKNRCCFGFDWEVVMVFKDDDDRRYNSYWGICSNPECANYQKDIGPDDPFRGASNVLHEDFVEWLAYQAFLFFT